MYEMRLIAAFLIFTVAGVASADSIDVGDVGGWDDFVIATTLANSGNAEQAWIEGLASEGLFGSDDVDYTQLGDESGGDNWVTVFDGDGETPLGYAFDFSSFGVTPSYFLVKLGVGAQDTTESHYLFENGSSLDWAFVSLELLGGAKNIGKVSHVGYLGGPGVTVPEPGTLALLGLGLIGIGIARRRRVA